MKQFNQIWFKNIKIKNERVILIGGNSQKKNFLCIYKMVLKITKETWEKCGITTAKYYNKKKDIIELWQKMNDVKKETGHLNITDTALRRIKKLCGKEIKDVTAKEKKNTKNFLKIKMVFLLLKSLHAI